MEKRDKLWRKTHEWRVYKARMIRFANNQMGCFDNNGNYIQNPHWFDLAKSKDYFVFKTTGTPCSCWLCRKNRYNRLENKKEFSRFLKESLE